jgi:nucleoside-diphosphate-sugar epimerase
MSTLILGSKGYIGKKLLSRLHLKQQIVFGLFRDDNSFYLSQIDSNQLETIVWSGQFNDLEKVLQRLNITKIINLAGSTLKETNFESISRLCKDNIEFTAQMGFMATRLKVKHFVYASTYSTSINGEYYSPQTFYAASKKAAEDTLIFFSQSMNLKVTILNFYDVYGPHQPHKRIVNVILTALLEEKILEISLGDQEINLVYIEDVLDACELVLEDQELIMDTRWCHFTVAGSEIFKVKDLPNIIGEIARKKWSPNQVQKIVPFRHNEIWVYKPIHPIVPNFIPKVNIIDGISNLLKSYSR